MEEINQKLNLIIDLQKYMQKDLTNLNDKYEKLDNKIDNVEINLSQRIDKLEEKVDSNYEKLDNKIDAVNENLNNKIDELEHKVDRNRVEALLYYKNLDKKLDENLEDIGEMFQDLFSNMPA